MLMGDFNATMGKELHVWGDVLGRHGMGKINSNGLRLLTLCPDLDLQLTNTLFQLADISKNTRKHPRSSRKRDSKAYCSTRIIVPHLGCVCLHENDPENLRSFSTQRTI